MHLLVQEWHFHVYFLQNNNASYQDAMRLRDLLIRNVAAGKFVCVLNGVTSEMVPGLDESQVPHVNMQPVGPHPIGSYEVKMVLIRGSDRRKINRSHRVFFVCWRFLTGLGADRVHRPRAVLHDDQPR